MDELWETHIHMIHHSPKLVGVNIVLSIMYYKMVQGLHQNGKINGIQVKIPKFQSYEFHYF